LVNQEKVVLIGQQLYINFILKIQLCIDLIHKKYVSCI
jgi:hypothetical protein